MQQWRRQMRKSGRAEAPNPAPSAPEAAAAPRPEETQGMRLEREARDLDSSLAELATVGTTTRRGRTRVAATLKTCETG